MSEPANPVSKALRAIGSAFGTAPSGRDYIKRVIGKPGDRVKCCDAQGRVSVNGIPLDEKSYLYTDPRTHRQNEPSEESFDVTVPPGHLWVMGDHRRISQDSRAHRGDPRDGTVPTDRVIGHAFVIVWPLNEIGTLPTPKTFKQPAMRGAAALSSATPITLGLIGAVPLTYLTRRIRPRGARRSA